MALSRQTYRDCITERLTCAHAEAHIPHQVTSCEAMDLKYAILIRVAWRSAAAEKHDCCKAPANHETSARTSSL